MIKGRAIETGVLGLVLVKKSTSLLKLAVLVRRFDVGKSLFLETRFVRLCFFFIVPPNREDPVMIRYFLVTGGRLKKIVSMF